MEITVGREYLRRDGQQARVAAIQYGLFRVWCGGMSYCVDATGRAVSHSRKHDLVALVTQLVE